MLLDTQSAELDTEATVQTEHALPDKMSLFITEPDCDKEPEEDAKEVEGEHKCGWESCTQKFETLKELVLHAHEHIHSLDWSARYLTIQCHF